jgi:hypothetical protein
MWKVKIENRSTIFLQNSDFFQKKGQKFALVCLGISKIAKV